MQPFPGAVVADDVVVAHPRHDPFQHVGGVDDDVHVLLYGHGLVVAHQGALDHVVALAVAVQPLFLGTAVAAHEIVVGLPDVPARRAGLEQAEGEAPRLEGEVELVLQFLRGPAQHAGAADLGEEAAGAVVLDQQRQLVAVADLAVLLVARA